MTQVKLLHYMHQETGEVVTEFREAFKWYQDGADVALLMLEGVEWSCIALWKHDDVNADIRGWYMENYPTDDLGAEINEGITFYQLWYFIDRVRGDLYSYIGVGDSVIRERLFSELARLGGCSYEEVYNAYLLCS